MYNRKSYKIALVGIFAAMSYVLFTFCQFKISLPGGDATSFHLGNVMCLLGGLIGGPLLGGLGGAIGMTIGDVFDPIYIVYAPKTFILKFFIGAITGLVAHKIGHISKLTDKKAVTKLTWLSCILGVLFNAIFDPLVGFLYKILIMGKPAAEVALTWNVLTTSVNAVISCIVAAVAYTAIRPILIKNELL